MAEICRRFGVSRRTAYKWMKRFELAGPVGLADRSRRPHRSPGQTTQATERWVLAVRREHRVWGGRKIRHVLLREGFESVPAASTITEILRRHGQLEADESSKHRPLQRFEHPEPNDLWQMDFKGHFKHGRGRCHPLTVLDDHSRFGIGLQACPNEGGTTVKAKERVCGRRPLRSARNSSRCVGRILRPEGWGYSRSILTCGSKTIRFTGVGFSTRVPQLLQVLRDASAQNSSMACEKCWTMSLQSNSLS